MQVQFTHDIFTVTFHRLRADHQRLGNPVVGGSLGQQGQHLLLALGQPVQRGLMLRGVLLREIILHQQLRQRRVQIHLPQCRGADGRQQLLGGGALWHIARSPRLQHLEKIFLVLVDGQCDDGDFGELGFDDARCLDAGHIGQADIHQDDVRSRGPRGGYRFRAASRLPDDFHVRLAGQQHLQPRTDNGMVIHQ